METGNRSVLEGSRPGGLGRRFFHGYFAPNQREANEKMAAMNWPKLAAAPFKILCAASTTYITASIIFKISKESLKKLLESKLNTNYKTSVLFFPDQTYACRCRISPRRNPECVCQGVKSTMETLKMSLKEAKRSLDICMFTISSPQLANVVLQMHAKGVIVRVVTDGEKMDLVMSQTMNFRAAGIQVRSDKSSFLMHNKFIIIDRETLVNGSFNWTNQAVYGNKENVLITNYPPIVEPYLKEFEHLWEEYDHVKQQQAAEDGKIAY